MPFADGLGLSLLLGFGLCPARASRAPPWRLGLTSGGGGLCRSAPATAWAVLELRYEGGGAAVRARQVVVILALELLGDGVENGEQFVLGHTQTPSVA
jgi:hypothetical protein